MAINKLVQLKAATATAYGAAKGVAAFNVEDKPQVQQKARQIALVILR